MEKSQAVAIVKKLVAFYPGWKVDKYIVDAWVEALLDENYQNVTQNMMLYIKNNEYPPPIAALLRKNNIPVIPEVDEEELKEIEEMARRAAERNRAINQ